MAKAFFGEMKNVVTHGPSCLALPNLTYNKIHLTTPCVKVPMLYTLTARNSTIDLTPACLVKRERIGHCSHAELADAKAHVALGIAVFQEVTSALHPQIQHQLHLLQNLFVFPISTRRIAASCLNVVNEYAVALS